MFVHAKLGSKLGRYFYTATHRSTYSLGYPDPLCCGIATRVMLKQAALNMRRILTGHASTEAFTLVSILS